MSKASTGFAFVAGLTIGAAGAWYYLKDKYAKLAEEEIASVKAAYAKREKPTTEEKTVSLVNAAKNMDKGSITEYTQRLQEAGYKDYSRTIDEKPSGTPGEVPYVISPDEFGELEGYTKVKLPDINADVAVVIDALTRVCVDLDASTEDFYKVRTSDGVEGFCMRKYIALSK